MRESFSSLDREWTILQETVEHIVSQMPDNNESDQPGDSDSDAEVRTHALESWKLWLLIGKESSSTNPH